MHAATPTFPGPAGDARPWYAQRWPWLLMLGPALVIVAGSFTTYLAVQHDDAMVVDDYYKKGKAINQDLRRDRAASMLRIGVEAAYDASTGTLAGELRSFGQPYARPFRLYLAHATLPQKDIVRDVQPDAAGHFTVKLPQLERARWGVVVEGQQRDWRLASSWHWPAASRVLINADPVNAP